MKDVLKQLVMITWGIVFLVVCMPLSAYDWGLFTAQNISVEGMGTDILGDETKDSVEYTGALIPWISAPLGDGGDMYLSASLAPHYLNKRWELVPELLRTEVSFRIKETGELTIGRMNYTDSLGLIADGLFDGVYYSIDYSKKGTIGIGAWYTGLLYKRTAYITMTEEDLALYYAVLDYGDFINTYCAPRRIFGAIDWDYYGIGELAELNCTLIGQFDLSGRERLYHSVYLMAKLSIPVKSFVLEAGGCAELAIASQRYYAGFAGELGVGWYLPTSIQDRLMLLARISNGSILDNHIAPFVPITTIPQGGVLRAKLSGLSMISLDYTARFHETFSIQVTSSYFVLSDLISYEGPIKGRDGYFLGNEFYGRVIWSPVSDVYIACGGGVFLPSLGNADRNADMLWRAELVVKMVFF